MVDEAQRENLGPAETIIQSLLTYSDHLYHGRPGIVTQDNRTKIGVRWDLVTHKVDEDGQKVVYKIEKGREPSAIGVLRDDNKVMSGRNEVGEYRKSGLFPEVAIWFYKQIAEVWRLDNEFAARWASFAFKQEHRDLKVVLAAFMLVQSRKGDPVYDGGEHIFDDEDFRNVGEAMFLLQEKKKDFSPKMLMRVWEVLNVPEIAAINHELGFGKSAKKPFLGRWTRVVEKWLRYREENPKMLEGLVKAGFRSTVTSLAQRVGYKPTHERFFEILRWAQKQAKDGRRTIAIGKAIAVADSWSELSEEQICERIEKERLSWKRITSLLPKEVGVTRSVLASAIESNSLSNKDLVILTPTLEDLGLLKVQDIKARWDSAVAEAEDMRAANIARNVRSKETREQLEAGADKAVQKIVEESTRGIDIQVLVDISGSMEGAIEKAKPMIAKLVQAFPPERVRVVVFNTAAREIRIQHASSAGVQAAFRGIHAGGGTDYRSGVVAMSRYKPAEDTDLVQIYIGDQQAPTFKKEIERSELNPVAFGFIYVKGRFGDRARAVEQTAESLGIPCFRIDDETFEDPYAIPRTIRALIAATPVGVTTARRAVPRVTLVDQILQTELLQKPAWA